MAVKVLFFARFREDYKLSQLELDWQTDDDADQIWSRATNNQPRPTNALVAINQKSESFDTKVEDGDEVAFFPPVTGG